MENDFLETPKLKGMTIFKAFLLVFLCITCIHVIGFFFQTGFLYGFFVASVDKSAKIGIKLNTYAQLASYLAFIFIGFKTNNFEKPFFSKTKLSDYGKILVLGVLWIIFCIFLNDLVETKSIGAVPVNQDFKEYFDFKGSIRNLNSILYIILHIGVLGHGLLKNYDFSKVLVAMSFFSLPMLHPTVVLQYFFLNLILIFIYYNSRALQLTLVFMLVALVLDHVLAVVYSPYELRYGNIIKNHLIGHESVYNLFMVGVFIAFILILYSLRNPIKQKSWLKAQQ